MSLSKYHGEIGGAQHGDLRLQWPGTIDGLPVLATDSAHRDLKQEEVENLDERRDFKSRMFLLWDPVDKAMFDDISDKLVNGWYRLVKRTDNWDEQQKHYRIWMEWYQVYGLVPPAK